MILLYIVLCCVVIYYWELKKIWIDLFIYYEILKKFKKIILEKKILFSVRNEKKFKNVKMLILI